MPEEVLEGHRHHGSWSYHDDDCWCVLGDAYCNRDGWVWSCCGACKRDSECSAPHTHPTYWQHEKHGQTIAGYDGIRPRYKSNAEIRRIAPECFDDGDGQGTGDEGGGGHGEVARKQRPAGDRG